MRGRASMFNHMEFLKSHFGQKLKDARLNKGLKQKDIADLFDIDPSNVSRWENGRDFPEDERLPKLLDALGVDHQYFISEKPRTIAQPASDYAFVASVITRLDEIRNTELFRHDLVLALLFGEKAYLQHASDTLLRDLESTVTELRRFYQSET